MIVLNIYLTFTQQQNINRIAKIQLLLSDAVL